VKKLNHVSSVQLRRFERALTVAGRLLHARAAAMLKALFVAGSGETGRRNDDNDPDLPLT